LELILKYMMEKKNKEFINQLILHSEKLNDLLYDIMHKDLFYHL